MPGRLLRFPVLSGRFRRSGSETASLRQTDRSAGRCDAAEGMPSLWGTAWRSVRKCRRSSRCRRIHIPQPAPEPVCSAGISAAAGRRREYLPLKPAPWPGHRIRPAPGRRLQVPGWYVSSYCDQSISSAAESAGSALRFLFPACPPFAFPSFEDDFLE